jgi:outer membrane lipoprotein LolB
MSDWQINGKLGIKTDRDGGSAALRWIQSGDSFHLTLSGPLGQGTTIIAGNEEGARLENSQGETHLSDSAETLLYQHTGWQVPLHFLLFWIKGLPEPYTTYQLTRTPEGLIHTLTQGSWHLIYDRYALVGQVYLPHKIKIIHQDLKLTLLIHAWTALPPESETQPHQNAAKRNAKLH